VERDSELTRSGKDPIRSVADDLVILIDADKRHRDLRRRFTLDRCRTT
jgi:hypothetical protein